MDLLDLFVKIGLDTTALDKGINNVEKKMQESADKLDKGAKDAGKKAGDGISEGLDVIESKVNKFAYNVGAAIGTATKALAGLVSGAAVGAVALVKQSVDAYKNTEQLIGGVETLFSNLEGTVSAAPAVLEKANDAYKNAGMSANQYMETVTSFSAALIAGLNNDYEKAAEISDMAVVDMSDNANKMGTSLESLRYAYAGFAKQNYTMLDNLKLGYGGTKEEMERLLKDAEKLSGVKYDMSNLGDVYKAIHVIQEEMGITGTTAKEAEHTIEGSLNSLSSAWQNLVAGFADKNANLEQLINNVVSAGLTALDNLLPATEQAFSGLVKAVEGVVPIITKELPKLTNKMVPAVLDAAVSMVDALISALPDTLDVIIDIVPSVIDKLVDTFTKAMPQITDLGLKLIVSLADGVSKSLPKLVPVAVETVLGLVDALVSNVDLIADASVSLITSLAEGLITSLPILIEKAPAIIIKLTTALITATPKIAEATGKIIKTMADGLVHVDWRETADKMMTSLISALDQSIKQVAVWIDNATSFLTGQESKYGGDIANVPTSEFITWMEMGKDDVVDAVGDVTESIAQSYDDFYGVIEDGNDKANELIKGGYYDMPASMSDYASSLEKQTAQWKKSINKSTAEVEEDMEEVEKRLKAKFQEFEIAMYENGYTEEWLVHQERQYLETINHGTELYAQYNLKLLKEEQKITKTADAERKKMVQDKFAEFERTALQEGKTEQWLLQQERNFIETLDHASALYEEFDLKLLQSEKKLNDEIQKQREKDAENTRKAFEKTINNVVKSAQNKIKEYKDALNKIKDDIKSFGDSLTKSYSDMFTFDIDEKTGKMTAKKTENYLHDATKQLETYYKNIEKLRKRGIDEDMLDELTKMDVDKGAAVASYWASLSDKELKSLEASWKKYEEASGKVSESLYSDELAEAEKQLDEERNNILKELLKTVTEGMPSLMSTSGKSDTPAGNITINVAGQKVIDMAINTMLSSIKNSGGVLNV